MLARTWIGLISIALVFGAERRAASQIIFSDSAFAAASYNTSSAGTADIRMGINYSSFDMFGDGFLTVNIPPSPRGGGSTSGAFVAANNNSLGVSQTSFAAIMPKNLNVGTGTANPNYVMRVDVFHSTGTGIDNASGTVSLIGTTTYSLVGLNQTDPIVQVQLLNGPVGGRTGQGIHLGITADSGAQEDYVPLFGGALYRDRAGLAIDQGRTYSGAASGVDTGLAGDTINDYWQGRGFELSSMDSNPNNDLVQQTGDHVFFAPSAANSDGFRSDGAGVDRSFYLEEFGKTAGPHHFVGGGVNPPAFIRPNDSLPGGVPYNRWATHEVYWVDGAFTYVIDGVPVQQFKPDFDGLNGNDNILNGGNLSRAGTVLLGHWDPFGASVAVTPDGVNFVIYDNLEVRVATAAEVPNLTTYLELNGYIGVDGDYNQNGVIDAADYVMWRNNFDNGAPLPNDNTIGVDVGDYMRWRGNFGRVAGGNSAGGSGVSLAAPEPSTTGMLIVAILAHARCRRRESDSKMLEER